MKYLIKSGKYKKCIVCLSCGRENFYFSEEKPLLLHCNYCKDLKVCGYTFKKTDVYFYPENNLFKLFIFENTYKENYEQ